MFNKILIPRRSIFSIHWYKTKNANLFNHSEELKFGGEKNINRSHVAFDWALLTLFWTLLKCNHVVSQDVFENRRLEAQCQNSKKEPVRLFPGFRRSLTEFRRGPITLVDGSRIENVPGWAMRGQINSRTCGPNINDTQVGNNWRTVLEKIACDQFATIFCSLLPWGANMWFGYSTRKNKGTQIFGQSNMHNICYGKGAMQRCGEPIILVRLVFGNLNCWSMFLAEFWKTI